MTEYRTIVGLGSSFAAGPGIEPVEDAGAMRSSRNYVHLLAERLGAEVVDLSVSGATTTTILDAAQTAMTGAVFAPQIDAVPAHADLVTVTAGGNDLQFVGTMLYAAWSRARPDSPVAAMLAEEFPHGFVEPSDPSVEAMADGLARIVAEVRTRAPAARVVLVDYLTVIDGYHDASDWPFSAEQTALALRIQHAVARGHLIAARRSGAEVLRASDLSRGHGLGSPDPWVFPFVPTLDAAASSFHPNAAGMRVIAEALAALLAPR